MRKQLLLLWLFAFTIQVALAQDAPNPMSWKDVATWKSMPGGGYKLSPDGQWMAYILTGIEADGELILQKTADPESKKSFPIGNASFASFEFSDNSQWIAFKEYPKFVEKQANEKAKGKPLKDKVHLLKLGTDDKKTFEGVGGFSFNGQAATHLVINLPKEGNGDAKGSDLLIYHLAAGKSQNLGNVREHAVNKAGTHLAYTVDAANSQGNGLYLLTMASNSIQVLDSDEAGYQSINWTEKGDAFAALKMKKDKKYKQDKGAVLGVKNLSNPQVTLYEPAKDSTGFDQNYTITPNRRPMWSEDLTRLFYGIHPLVLAEKEKPKKEINADSVKAAEAENLAKIMADTTIKSISDLQKAIGKLNSGKSEDKKANDAKKPDMTIWHWQDDRLQSRQKVLENMDKNYSFWAMYDVVGKKHIALQDSSMRDLNILPQEHFALGSDQQKYELDINLNGQQYRDYYLVDLKTGAKTLLFENFYQPSFASMPRPSTDGKKLLYGKDGNFYIYDILAQTHTNITEKLPVTFVNTEDDHNVEKPMQNPLGWSSDSQYVLLRDGWDIWQIALSGKESPVNLTQNGRAQKIRYQYRFSLDEEEKGIDLRKTTYVRMYGENTKKSGIATLAPAKKGGLAAGVKVLSWEDANIQGLAKAEKASVFTFTKENSNAPTQVYLTDASLSNPKQITENAPDASKFAWSAGVKLIDYVTTKGDSLQAALFLPAGYVEGQKYPTVVYYYEKLSQTLHNWANPGYSGTGWNPSLYTSNGYAVLIPDIVYKMDDPGMSAVWAVLPAVDAAIKTGVIDESKMGLHGHSWGGYQTSFLITQTNRFKAAAAGAPLTNMISMYDLIYWNTGGGNMSIFEASQGRFLGGPWENWEAYERNSPIYHVKNVQTPLLMLHNDKDGAVDFTQGVEYYNALRRLKKPVIMVQYLGENHGLGKLENRKDYSVRMMEFFDHHLKGLPAPDWMSKGVPRLKLGQHLEERAF
ncbi:prolyl oligopeptidase family serine peptidase [Algoriphagus sanaruensis]|uniref:Acylaminoacyl-peptidase n=1 Tax=Algoriphagus sanaruensis TaxID=1727163 RepID=A0A142EKZ1_9BACT|nr:prolyl oligopeptidase family serine peptidase [Algoriphagus sanaruensis]AMQ55796.1 acylaminoacyl-peptidase [Algoriphagus sanaruensis]